MDNNIMNKELKEILDCFGYEYHNNKFDGKPLPKLTIVVSPKENIVSVEQDFLLLPTVAFKVSFITGAEYCPIVMPEMKRNEYSNETGWNYFETKGFCAYFHQLKSVLIGYPYPTESKYLPLKRAIRHELGHYKQDVLNDARYNEKDSKYSTILEYHNIMINENTCADGPNNGYFQDGYRIGYELAIEKKDTKDASDALKLLKDKYPQYKPLLKDMCSFVNNEENQKRLKDINNKLVQNMCIELRNKKNK